MTAPMCAALLGCASTQVETTGMLQPTALCHAGGGPVSAVVYWMPQWRPDQKEPAQREAAAAQGMQEYFSSDACLRGAPIRRLEGHAQPPSDAQLLRQAEAQSPRSERVLLIVVRELGPKLAIGIPALVHGSTEVVLQVRVLDARSGHLLGDAGIHWENGGTFVVKGVGTLAQDLRAALQSVLESPAQ